ncbi:MAG: hypothetical protein GY819_06200 [Planctomycetaceae bacterium]|nr:hypothetical protein [Planctomycetaceae bacterium]
MACTKINAALAKAALELAQLVLMPLPFLGLARRSWQAQSRSYLNPKLKSMANPWWAGPSL